MEAVTSKSCYFEIKDPTDHYGLLGKYETAEKALDYINESYKNALEQGYDNRQNKWIIVCVEWKTLRDTNGNFLKEETVRFAYHQVEFSTYENAFVYCY